LRCSVVLRVFLMCWVSHSYGKRATQRLPQMPIMCYVLRLGSVFSYLIHQQLHGAEFSEDRIRPHLVKEFPAFFWNLGSVMSQAFTSSPVLTQMNPIHACALSQPPHHPKCVRSILIVSSTLQLGLTSDIFPSSFPIKFLWACMSPPCSPHAQHTSLRF